MKIYRIDKVIEKLTRDYETRDPFEIAQSKGIYVIEENLGEIYGYFHRWKRIKFIHINENLNECDKLITCSHELGHAICHPMESTPALTKANLVSELKIETEANYFATKLIIDNSHQQYYLKT